MTGHTLRTREEAEAVEAQTLAPYAQKSSATRGRAHAQAKHRWRTD